MDEVRQTVPIPLGHIIERDGFNARFEAGDISELAKSIESMGVLYPPLVVRANDRDPISETEYYYYLIHGHRKVRAMRALQWTTGQFFVANPDLSIVDQFILNLAENVRQDISKAEIAERCHRIIESAKRAGRTVTSEDLAKSIGYSSSYLRNLLQLRRSLHPDLWDVMVRAGNRAPIGSLLKVVTLPHHEQLDRWKTMGRVIEEAEEVPAGPKNKPTSSKTSWRSMAIELVKEAPPDCAKGARWLLEELGVRLARADIQRSLSEKGEDNQ